MTRRVFLHIGLPKTGTTYLQDAIWANKAALADRGVLVPGRHRRRHLLASLDLREDGGLAKRSGDVRAPWQDLADEVNAAADNALISHEFFAAASSPQICRAVAAFPEADLHIIVTARAMLNLGISRWQEWVKNGGGEDIDSYPLSDTYDPADEWGWASFDLADILDRWGSVVPRDRIHVIPMATGRAAAADLWSRFLSVMDVDPAGLPAPEAAVNQSLGVVEIELLRRVTVELTGFTSAADRGTWIRGYLGEGGVLPSLGERFRPGEPMMNELLRRGRRAQEMLATGDFDIVGDPLLLEPTAVDHLRHPQEVADSEILAAAVATIATLTRNVRELTRARDRLAKRANAEPDDRATVRPRLRRLGYRAPAGRRRTSS
jgi:hypothetical protein